MKPTYSLSVLFFLLLSVLPSPAQNSTHNFEVAKNLDIFNALYRELDPYYVDTLDAKKNIDNALAYMLEMLDPYTEYYPEEETSSPQELTTGKYAGIGTMVGYSETHHRCIISKPYAGMPAAQAGLLPGDIILARQEGIVIGLGTIILAFLPGFLLRFIQPLTDRFLETAHILK